MQGKTALVTGAGRGLGAAIASRLAGEGGWIACIDIDGDSARKTAQSLPGAGKGYELDVRDETAVKQVVDAVLDERGSLDVLINNAGIAGPQTTVTETPLNEWQATIDINLTGTFLVSKHAIPALCETRGNIVNIASALALIGWRREAAYGPSKAGVVQLTKSMALDYAEFIRVNCVCPGAIRTPMIEGVLPDDENKEALLESYGHIHPLYRRLALPEEIAEAVLFLASDDASLVTGVAMPVDGGFTAD